MKKTITTICLCLIALTFAFMFVFCIFFPRTTQSDYSTLYEWPEFSIEALKSGEYFKGITNYFSDTICLRDRFIDIETRIRSIYGIAPEEEVIDVPTTDESQADYTEAESSTDISGEEKSQAETSDASTGETSSETSSAEPEQNEAELSGTIIIIGNRTMEVFSGNFNNGIVFADMLNEFAATLDDDVNVYSMVVPKASAYYIKNAKQEAYSKTASANKDNIDNINEHLSNRITPINVYDTLEKHSGEPIYFLTDHHWTGLAAYYASEAFTKQLGLPFDDLTHFEKNVREGYVGTMYKYSNYNPKVLASAEDFVTYIPTVDYTATYYNREDFTSPKKHEEGLFWEIPDDKKSSWYSTFIRGDRYCVKVESGVCHNGRKLLIVKDSYGNPLPQYLLQAFEEIYVVDAREYKLSLKETVEQYGITDLLFVECTFSAVGGDYIGKLKEICK